MKVFILTGGLGTRLKPLTDNLPKVMITIGGRPILEHLINLCHFHNLNNIIISTYYLPKPIYNYFKDGKKFNVHLTYSHENTRAGSAGALKLAESLLKNDDFIVLNGDVLTNVNLAAMADFHRQKRGLATFLVHNTDHPFDSDIVEFNQFQLITRFFRPRADDKFKPIAKTGAHIFKPEVLNFIPQGKKYSLEKQLIPDLLQQPQSLYAFYSNCYSKDMGTPARLLAVQKDYEQGKISL